METEKSKDVNSAHDETGIKTEGRRKFLRKASAGALIATIPAKSVWATSALTNSVVASGNGSDLAGGQSLHMKNRWYWEHEFANGNVDSSLTNKTFKALFGGNAFKDSYSTFPDHLTLGQIYTAKDAHGQLIYMGPNKINLWLISAVLNAYYSDSVGHINFPVVGNQRNFPNIHAFGSSLYNMAKPNPAGVSHELSLLHAGQHPNMRRGA